MTKMPTPMYHAWLTRHAVPGSVLLRAQELHEKEDYAGSSALLAPCFAAEAVDQAGPDVRTLGEAVSLHAWNLLQSNQTEALSALLQRVEPGALVDCPDLAVVDLFLKVRQGDLAGARAGAEHYIDQNRDAIARHMSRFLYVLALVNSKSGDAESATMHLESAHAICAVSRDEFWSALVGNYLGFVHVQRSRYVDALTWLERSLAVFRRRELPRKQSLVHLHIGIAQYKAGDLGAARRHLDESLQLALSGGWKHNQCFANIALGNVHRLSRDFEAARRHLHTAYSQAQELEYPREEALALEFLGDVYRDEGQTEAARRFYARAIAIARQIAPEGDIVMEVCRRRGECLGLEGHPGDAMPELQRALELSRSQKDRFEEGVTLRVMSEIAYRLHDLAHARILAGKASEVLEEIGARFEAAIALLHGAEVRLSEVESVRGSVAGAVLLDEAWLQATRALDLFLRVGVDWWTDKCRATVARVTAMRGASERASSAGAVSGGGYAPGDIVVHASAAMRHLLQLCDQFAACDDPVLVTGETGTGKEVLARRLHRFSRRSDKPLVVVNVAAIPQTLFEREFFGHVKGAFSGAGRDSRGYAAQADGGTLFLDEIGELPLEVQPKLLRLLQDGTYLAIGDPKVRRADLRLVAATNADLRRLVAEGRFRADLYYRLQTLELEIIPLRKRPEDVLPLLRHFLCLAARREVDLGTYFDQPSMSVLERHRWPGNARELSMVARRAHLAMGTHGQLAVTLVGDGDEARVLVGAPGAHGHASAADSSRPLDATERSRLLLVMEENGGNRALAARTLGISRSTLYRRLARLGLANNTD